jgi:hypothetical protein
LLRLRNVVIHGICGGRSSRRVVVFRETDLDAYLVLVDDAVRDFDRDVLELHALVVDVHKEVSLRRLGALLGRHRALKADRVLELGVGAVLVDLPGEAPLQVGL